MHNSCDMRCGENAGTLQLNIKVNNENLPPRTNKYNVGSLKLPADPSWPKIPHRKLAEDAGDIIEPPYIVTLTDTPRRSRTAIHTPYQHSKSVTAKNSMNNPTTRSRKMTLAQTLKRRPGIVDPRFKRVTTVKSQDTTVYSSEQKHDMLKDTSCSVHTAPNETLSHSARLKDAIPEGDTNMQRVITQETKKLDELSCIEESTLRQTYAVSTQNMNTSEHNNIITEQGSKNTEISMVPLGETKFTDNLCIQGGVESKLHNAKTENLEISVQTASNECCCTKAELDRECIKAHEYQDVSNKLSHNNLQCPYSDSETELRQSNQQQQKTNRKCAKYRLFRKYERNTSYDETSDSDFNITRYQCAATIDHFYTCLAKSVERKHFLPNGNSEEQQPARKLHAPELNNLCNEVQNVIADRNSATKSQQSVPLLDPTPVTNQRRSASKVSRKAKSYFKKNARCVVPDSDYTLIWPGSHPKLKHSQENLENSITWKKDNVCNSLCRDNGAKEKTAQSTMCPTDSNVTVTVELNENKIKDKLQNTMSSITAKQQCYERRDTSNSLTEDSVNKPAQLSLKTQQLLNKNYWEYYNKLKHKIDGSNGAQQNYHSHTTVCSPDVKKRKCDNSNAGPEVHTLEQCSILSAVINQTLSTAFYESGHSLRTKQLHLTRDVKSSSDPMAGPQTGVLKKTASTMPNNTYEDSILSSTFPEKKACKAENTEDQSLLKLKTIIFFGCMMYALLVFLPMLYDYFFYEEFDEYQSMGYIDLAVEYILSSFREAYGDFFNMMNNIFFHPIRRNTKF